MWLCTHTTFCPAGSRICHCWKKSSTMWHRFNWWVVVCRPFVDINQHDNWYYWFYFYIETDTICIRILHLLGHLAVHRVQEQKEKALIDSGCEPVCISGLHIWWFLCENLLEEEEESIGSVRNICSWIFYYILLHGVVTSMASSIKPISVCVRVFLTYQKKNSYFFCDNFKANVYVMHCYLFSSAIMNDFVNFSNLFSHNINN